MQIIEFKGEKYPGFQAYGNAAQFAIPYAKYFCNGIGYDIGCLLYWTERISSGGVLFLYLPHYDQKYWRPWNNRKHKHAFVPEVIVDFMEENGYTNIFSSQRDLNHSFIVVGEKI